MEFPVPISPFLHTTYTKDYVLVNGAAAKQLSDKDCNKAIEQKITFYRVYLPARDYTENTYFDGVRSMLTLDRIAENGDEVSFFISWGGSWLVQLLPKFEKFEGLNAHRSQ